MEAAQDLRRKDVLTGEAGRGLLIVPILMGAVQLFQHLLSIAVILEGCRFAGSGCLPESQVDAAPAY